MKSLFEPVIPRRDAQKPRRSRRVRPPRLSQWLGKTPIKPPPAGLHAPRELASLPAKRPEFDSQGVPVPPPAKNLAAIEPVAPEALESDPRKTPHWDGPLWHDGRARGLSQDDGWVWLYKDEGRHWGLVGKTPLLRYQHLWWVRERRIWFAVHQGEPWAWRRFQDWGAEGLFHPGTGTEIVYSADFSRAAVIVPGEGATVYDAWTGAELGSIPEELMPRRRRPKAPRSLTLP